MKRYVLLFAMLVVLPIFLCPGGAASDMTPLSEPHRSDIEGVSPYDLGLRIPEMRPSMVILAPSEFLEATKPLARHRTTMGLPTALYSIDDIENNITGHDRERKVHDFLRALHQNNTSFNWLLIMGDSEHLMPRPLWHYALDRGQYYHNYYYSDMYYAGLDSTWDTDGNGRYGEFSNTTYTVDGDLDADVYVGRVPASTAEHVSNYVGKVIRYERNPPVGTWMKRFLNWGSVMEAPNNIEVGASYRYVDYRSNAYKVCTKVSEGLPDHIIEKPLYDYPQMEGGNYTIGDGRDTLNRNNMLGWIDTGASLLNFAGQARYAATSLNDYGPPSCNDNADNYVWNEPLRYSDHTSLQNGDMLPFMYLSTCNSASFHFSDNTLETFLTSESGGSIGFISSTGTSYRGEEKSYSWGNWYLDERFWEIFFDQGVTRPGQAMGILKEDYRQAWFGEQLPALRESVLGMIYSYVLLGDPYLDLYTDEAVWMKDPRDLGIRWYAGEHHYSVRIEDVDGEPIPFPRMTIFDPNTYTVVTGDGEGRVNFTIDLSMSSRVNVTFSAHNMVQNSYQYTVYPEIADLAILEEGLEVSNPDPVQGETVLISVPVGNIGGMVAENSRLHVGYIGGNGDPTYKVAQHDLGDLQADETRIISWNWTVRAGAHAFQLVAQTSSSEIDPSNNIVTLRFNTSGPDLQFSPGTGRIEPGDEVRPGSEVTIYYSIYNLGPAPGPVDIGIYDGDPDEGGLTIGEVQEQGPVLPMTYLNGSLSFTAPQNTSMIYIIMDPMGKYPPEMIGDVHRSLLVINYPPTLVGSPSMTVIEDSSWSSLALEGFFSDMDGLDTALEYSILSSPVLGSRIADAPDVGSVLMVRPPPDWFGETAVTLGVDDGLGEVEAVVQVTVSPVNDPPSFPQAPFNEIELLVLEDTVLSMRIIASDVEGDTVTFHTDSDLIYLDGVTGQVEWHPTQADVGHHVFEVVAKDGNGGETTLTIYVEVVEVNEGPLIDHINDMSCRVGEVLTFNVSAYDEEKDNLTYTSNLYFIDFEGRVGTINATGDAIGTHLVIIEVNDGINSNYISFNLTISDISKQNDGGVSVRLQDLMAAAGVALGLFAVLFLLFLLLRRRDKAGEMVDEEKKAVDSLYEDEKAMAGKIPEDGEEMEDGQE